MRHETIAQRLGNVFFWVFAGLSAPLALTSAVFFCVGLWDGGYHLYEQYRGPTYEELKEAFEEPNKKSISEEEQKKISKQLESYSTEQLEAMLAGNHVKTHGELAKEDAGKAMLSGMGAALLYAIGRAFRYILSGA